MHPNRGDLHGDEDGDHVREGRAEEPTMQESEPS